MNATQSNNGTSLTPTVQQPVDPLTLLQATIAAGNLDTDKLEKLMDLQDRWTKQQAETAYAKSMTECQLAMPVVVRDAENSHTKNRYARLEAINNQIKPIYASHGFSLSFGTEAGAREGCVRVFCDCSHIGGCTKRITFDIPLDGKGAQGGSNMSAIQGMGSSITYARKYLTLMVFNVTVANEDSDGDGDMLEITPEQVATLERMIEESGTNVPRFMEWAQIKDLKDMPGGFYRKAVAMLRLKIDRNRKAGAK